jgi:hypothetical protein
LLEIEYEDLIANREAVTRRMVEFAGPDWDDACLHHESNERAVNTPSGWQVRHPIYNSSIGRWSRFEPWLGRDSGRAVQGSVSRPSRNLFVAGVSCLSGWPMIYRLNVSGNILVGPHNATLTTA